MSAQQFSEFLNTKVTVYRDPKALVIQKPGYLYMDCYLLRLEVEKTVLEAFRETFTTWVKTYPDRAGLEANLGYLEAAPFFGDFGRSLAAFGIGQLLGLWRVITPRDQGVEEPRAGQMARGGHILLTDVRLFPPPVNDLRARP